MNKDLNLLKNDLYIREFIQDNNLSDDFLDENYNVFLRLLDSRKKCLNCSGLNECRQGSNGQRLSLRYDGVLIEEVEYCNYGLSKQNKANLKSSYVYCDIPNHLLDIDLNNIEFKDNQKELYLKLASILHNKTNKGLYISGDLGVGKTYLCIALCNSLVKNGNKVAFVKVSNFFNEMRSLIGTNESLDRKISILKNCDYLVLDDIGSETVSEFVRDDILFPILDYRLENKLITIFTSNLNKDDLLRHYQYDRKEKANLMNAKRLLERIDILSEDYVLDGKNLRRY